MSLLEVLAMVLLAVASLGVAGLAVTSLAVHTWRQLRGGREEHATDEILDRLDQIELRLAAVSERLLPRDSGDSDESPDSEDRRDSGTVADGRGGDTDGPPPGDGDEPA